MVMDLENRREWVADEPCLMLFHRAKGVWQFYQRKRLFCMKLEELDESYICSSRHGWLLVYRKKHGFLFFFDPFNRRTIELPGIIGYTNTSLHFFNPPTSPNCFVVAILGDMSIFRPKDTAHVSIFRRGMANWDHCEYELSIPFDVTMSPPVFRQGLLYFVGTDGSVATWDVESNEDPAAWCVYTTGLLLKLKHHFLFEIKGDEALYAAFLVGDAEVVSVFRLREPEMEWELVEDLGENTVHLSQGSCFGHATSSHDMANKIYFPVFHHHSMLSYSLDDQRYHSLEGDYSHDNTCYGLRRADIAATWILPTNKNVTDWTVDWSIDGDSDSDDDDDDDDDDDEDTGSEDDDDDDDEDTGSEDEEDKGSAPTVLSRIYKLLAPLCLFNQCFHC